ncbi:hypothetical protein [Lacunimicrobium album]
MSNKGFAAGFFEADPDPERFDEISEQEARQLVMVRGQPILRAARTVYLKPKAGYRDHAINLMTAADLRGRRDDFGYSLNEQETEQLKQLESAGY